MSDPVVADLNAFVLTSRVKEVQRVFDDANTVPAQNAALIDAWRAR
jgi:hypothetical protein